MYTPTRGLTPLQARFASEYQVDLNGTRAYMRASPDACEKTAATESSLLLKNPLIAREIQRLVDEKATSTGITAARVLTQLWTLATADPRELVEYRVGSCRHCWGMYGQRQFTDAEFEAAQDRHTREQVSKAKKDDDYVAVPFPEKGGPGFDPNRPPNAECGECWGDGEGRDVLHDTRFLSEGAQALYAGVKRTKDGVTILTHDPMKALELVGRHLNMWTDKGPAPEQENPLMALMREIQESHSTFKVVADDPELRQRPDIEDVEAKPAIIAGRSPSDPPAPARRVQLATKWRAV